MQRNYGLLAAVLLLTACDGNPFVDPVDTDTSEGRIYGNDIDPDLSMNSLAYDAENDQLIINNIPFDGATAPNGEAIYANVGKLGESSFQRYENVAGNLEYFAVFRRSTSGAVQAGAAATARYIDFGFGGVAARRTASSVTLPASGEYEYTGEYAAVRVYDSSEGGLPDPQYVTGAVELSVDFGDFDTTGAVVGLITNRQLFDMNGAALGPMDDFVSLATAEIDRDTQTLNASTASGVSLTDSTSLTSGSWRAVFGAAGGVEVAGIVVLEGAPQDEGDGSVPVGNIRETGVFIALR